MREVKKGFISFSVFQFSIYGSKKGDEGADTILMFQVCLPYNSIFGVSPDELNAKLDVFWSHIPR